MLYAQQHSVVLVFILNSAPNRRGSSSQASPLLVTPVTYARALVTSYQKKSTTSWKRSSPLISYRLAAPITCGMCVLTCRPRGAARRGAGGGGGRGGGN